MLAGARHLLPHEAVVLDQLGLTEPGQGLAGLMDGDASSLGHALHGRVRLGLSVADGEEGGPKAEGSLAQLSGQEPCLYDGIACMTMRHLALLMRQHLGQT
jgi:hypothetical protein